MTHKVTNDRLHKINASIPKIAIVTGDGAYPSPSIPQRQLAMRF